MMYPIDPWGPGPTRPDEDDAPESKADSTASSTQAPAKPKLAVTPDSHQAGREQPTGTAGGRERALAPPKPHPGKPSAFARALDAARVVLPVVQKVLPLLEGNVASAAANLLAPSPHPVDLEPVKTAIGKLQTEQRTLRGQLTDQRHSLESIEAELTVIKEGLDRNSSEIRELAEDQLKLSRRLTRMAWMMFILLFLSLGLTALICVRLAYILRL